MITSLCWIRKGYAKSVPVTEAVDRRALADQLGAADASSSSGDDEPSKDRGVRGGGDDEIMKQYNLDAYDDEDVAPGGGGSQYYAPGETDPYLVEVDDEDMDDIVIRPTDLLIATAHTDEDEWAHLDLSLYEPEVKNLYVHHHVVLPATPLCLEWLSCDPLTGEQANLIAVGMFQPGIELWDMDVIDAVAPRYVLGGELDDDELELLDALEAQGSGGAGGALSGKQAKKRAEKMAKRAKEAMQGGGGGGGGGAARDRHAAVQLRKGSHTAPVLDLSWNLLQRELLASASADQSVRIWDLSRAHARTDNGISVDPFVEPITVLTAHSREVQCVQWHLQSASALVSASYDKTAVLSDVRDASKPSHTRFKLRSDAEQLQWSTQSENIFYVSLDNGYVQCFDVRNNKRSVYDFDAHTGKPVTGISISPAALPAAAAGAASAMLGATVSHDGICKLWSMTDTEAKMVSSKTIGPALFACAFCPDTPNLLAVAGKCDLRMIDVSKIGVEDLMMIERESDGEEDDDDDDEEEEEENGDAKMSE